MSAPDPKQIRDAYSDYREEWTEIRDEAAIDMRYVAGDPWDAQDRQQRDDAGRPCISLDEVNQYLNQYINNLRQNKRTGQAIPKGDGANDDDAKKRSNLIMGIDERSNAQLAHITAAENAVSRSYGYSVLRTEYKDFTSFDQEIIIQPILNPDTVLFNPNYKQPDASDVTDAFLLDMMTKKAFKDKFPKARATDFSGDTSTAPGIADWIKDKYVQIAEYWIVERESSKLLLVETEGGPEVFTADEWKQAREFGIKGEVKRERKIEKPYVMQYMTNGLEILEETPWAGSRIPIIGCFGKEIWVTESGTAKRKLLSMVRLARDPQMLLAYLVTQECEIAGMIPKSPYIGAKGQFESDQERWEHVNQQPVAFLQYDALPDSGTGTPFPPPQRQSFEVDFQQWEIAKDSASRAIQRAMGISALPQAAQRENEKSGIAIERMQTEQAIGSFHFTDNYDRYLRNCYWQVNELITPILDTERQMPIVKPDGSRTLMHLVGNTSHPIEQGKYEIKDLPPEHLHTGKGEFDVTISTGPDYQSEREKQSSFVDTLLENLASLGIPQPIGMKILALAVKMKDLGPIGDEISQWLSPPNQQNLPPEAQVIVQQLQAQVQQLQQENATLHLERAGKVLELQNKQTIEAMKGQHQLDKATMDFITQIVKAELAKGSQQSAQQAAADADKELAVLGFNQDHIDRAHQAAHEAGMQAVEQAHERQQAATQLATAQAQQAQNQNNGNSQV